MARTKEPARRRTLMRPIRQVAASQKPEVVITQPPPAPSSAQPRVKVEPSDSAALLRASKLTIIIKPRPPVVLKDARQPWKHPDELEYIRPHDWSEDRIISYLCKNGFSVPPRPAHSMDPWTKITGADGTTTVVPRGYRLPLMFAAKFQWESLRLVMTSAARDEEWEDYKFDILHVSRLCARFLEEARQAMGVAGMDKSWRSPMFDRALTRYYRRWLVNREEFLKDFWKEFEEEEYERDVLKNDWTRFVLKGHKGFHLTKQEIQTGFTFEDLTYGLGFIRGRMNWITPGPDTASRSTSLSSKPEPPKGPALPAPDPAKAPAVPHSCGSTVTTTAIIPIPLSPIPPPSQTPMPPQTQTQKDDTWNATASTSTSSTPKAVPSQIPVSAPSTATSGKPATATEQRKETNAESIQRLKKMAGIARAMVAASVSPAPTPTPAASVVSVDGTENGIATVDDDARSLQVKREIMSRASTDMEATDQERDSSPLTEPEQDDFPPPVSESEDTLVNGRGALDEPTDQNGDVEMGSVDGVGDSGDGVSGGTTQSTTRSRPPPPPPTHINTDVRSPLSPQAPAHLHPTVQSLVNGNAEQPSPSPTKEKGRSNWDARVSAALERARIMAGAKVGDERGVVGGGAHGVNGIGINGSIGSGRNKSVSVEGLLSPPPPLPTSSSVSSTSTAPTSTPGPSAPENAAISPPQALPSIASTPQPQPESEQVPEPTEQEQEQEDGQYKLTAAAWSSSAHSTEVEMGDSSSSSSSRSSSNGGPPSSQPPPPMAPPPPLPSSPLLSSLSLSYPGSFGARIGSGVAVKTPKYRRRSTMGVGRSGSVGTPLGRSPVVKKIVSMFRNTLEGLTDILDEVGREEENEEMDIDIGADEGGDEDGVENEEETGTVSYLNSRPLKRKRSSISSSVSRRHSSFVAPVASTSTVQSAPPDNSLVGELLSEIKALQRRLQEDAERKAEHDAEVAKIQGEMEELKRRMARLDGERDAEGTSVDGVMKSQNLSQQNSPRAWDASFSSSMRTGPRFNPDLSFASSYSQSHVQQSTHPLAHILALDAEVAPPINSPQLPQDTSTPVQASRVLERESTSVSIASTSDAVFMSTPERSVGFASAPLKHRRSAPARSPSPCLETEMGLDKAKDKGKGKDEAWGRERDSMHDDVPLPVKSQRKHRMMFAPRPTE